MEPFCFHFPMVLNSSNDHFFCSLPTLKMNLYDKDTHSCRPTVFWQRMRRRLRRLAGPHFFFKMPLWGPHQPPPIFSVSFESQCILSHIPRLVHQRLFLFLFYHQNIPGMWPFLTKSTTGHGPNITELLLNWQELVQIHLVAGSDFKEKTWTPKRTIEKSPSSVFLT